MTNKNHLEAPTSAKEVQGIHPSSRPQPKATESVQEENYQSKLFKYANLEIYLIEKYTLVDCCLR